MEFRIVDLMVDVAPGDEVRNNEVFLCEIASQAPPKPMPRPKPCPNPSCWGVSGGPKPRPPAPSDLCDTLAELRRELRRALDAEVRKQ